MERYELTRSHKRLATAVKDYSRFIAFSEELGFTHVGYVFKADFVVNDTEAKALTQTDSISTALRLLKAKMLIITLGGLGAIIKAQMHADRIRRQINRCQFDFFICST